MLFESLQNGQWLQIYMLQKWMFRPVSKLVCNALAENTRYDCYVSMQHVHNQIEVVVYTTNIIFVCCPGFMMLGESDKWKYTLKQVYMFKEKVGSKKFVVWSNIF